MTTDQPDSPRRTVLVVGANGYLGGYVAAACVAAGWRVLRGIRVARREDERAADLARMTRAADWHASLRGVDAVVNAAGILREAGSQSFDAIHVDGPLALAQACVACGVAAFVQISALGQPQDGEFVASKQRFDEALTALPLRAVVLRPSVVFATGGSYGGTSLLRALAAFPGFQLMPGQGQWPIQPLAAEDLGTLVAKALDSDRRGIYEVGGPRPLPLRDYQACWRRWLRIDGEEVFAVTMPLVAIHVGLSEWLGRGPIGATMWRMLQRGNVTAADAWARLRSDFGFAPRDLAEVLAVHPSQVQDRWQAQLYFLAPTLRIAVIALWLLSALVGWITPASQILALTDGSFLHALAPVELARATASLDALLALWLATNWRPRWALGLMGISVLTYTVVFGSLLPSLWLDLLGGLAKNLVILPAMAALWVLVDRR